MEKGFTNFNELNSEASVDTVVNAADEKKLAKKAKLQEMANVFKQSLSEDPTLKDKINLLSESIAVVHTLGFGDSGNIILDKSKADGERSGALVATSQIVGYQVQNTGKTPVQYMTEEYAQDGTGVWVGTKVQKTLEPGATTELTRKYMTIFCSQPEISFKLQNGKIIRGSGTIRPNDVDGELEAYYFIFNDKNIKVNSDEVKLNIATKTTVEGGASKWIVKDEFVSTFGYLNNEKSATKKSRGSKATSRYTTQDMAANFIQKLISESGNM